uniref:Uncharacterized protein n=1 Tax=viral metagenome TaxID=1070528 RepID=A0A6C0BLT9_9ZZZZ
MSSYHHENGMILPELRLLRDSEISIQSRRMINSYYTWL